MKKTPLFTPLLLPLLLLAACSDAPQPIRQLRAQSLSYGDLSYRIYHYDDKNRISSITTGLVNEGDSANFTNHIRYDGDKIDKFEITDQAIIDYIYDGDKIRETREYLSGVLIAIHHYTHDTHGRVITWEIERIRFEGEEPVPDNKYTYDYNADGNLITQQAYVFQESEYRLLHTITYEDFDDKKNSDILFLTDLYNFQHIKFKNNPRTWRLVNAGSGATAEEHFQFEYNEQGYVTRSIPAQGSGIIYRFSEF